MRNTKIYWKKGKASTLFICLFISFTIIINVSSCDNDDEVTPDPTPFSELVAGGFAAPVALVEAPDESSRLFVVDQPGQIWIITANGTRLQTPFLDIRGRIIQLRDDFDERGLLSLAFHPQFATNGKFYVYYSAPLRPEAPQDWNSTSTISEFTVSGNPDIADPASERKILQVDQPQFNHNAGTILFGPADNNLYIALGDGGGGHDVGTGHVEDWYDMNEGGNAQNITANFLGKILRIDVDSDDPYGIPAGNPFVGEDGWDEIYAYGLRNPFKMSFDLAGNKDLYAMDAGQHLWEEINIINNGNNYGWNVKEGTHCFNTDTPEESRPDCPDTDIHGNALIDPIIELANSHQPNGLGTVIVGGHIYRGTELPQFGGQYIFGVYSRSHESNEGAVYVAEPASSGLWDFEEITFGDAGGTLENYILSFGQDLDGEIYILASNSPAPIGTTGMVFKLVSQ